ncbi:MAG: hypothetical protein LUD00_11050 [Prevotellaceae bacterium]|nr:hypothetical protein [Prevotellaceae bacterium]
MNKSKLILKLAYLVGYLLFSGFSAYFTASSLSLNLLNGTNLWLVFVLVLVVAMLAGWCLTNVISELQKNVGASKVTFAFSLVGFFIFWTFSFVTNVHYFFVEKHGYSILTQELSSAKGYIEKNTTQSNKEIEDRKNIAIAAVSAAVHAKIDSFSNELDNTMNNRKGFGESCVIILNTTETILLQDSAIYGDKNEYVIFDDERDRGDIGITSRNRCKELHVKYASRMELQLKKKTDVIKNFYERQKNQNVELIDLTPTITELEEKHLPAVLKDGSVNAFYTYYNQQDGRVISKMPDGYRKECVVDSDGEIIKFNVYPSKRMFDTMSVWGDIFSVRIYGMTMFQLIIIALIFDIVSFILFY